jgi:hypothetical protein
MSNKYSYTAILSIQPPAEGEQRFEIGVLGQLSLDAGDQFFAL